VISHCLASPPSRAIIPTVTNEKDIVAPSFSMREAALSEATAIGELLRASYAEYRPNYTPEGWQRYYGILGDVESHFGRAEIIVAQRDGVLLGAVMFYADGSMSGQGDWPAGWAGILRLAVHPAHRGYGIGRALAEECVRRARDARVTTLALHATRWMSLSRAMYERMGFVRDESFDFVTRSGELAMGYRLDLDAG
jgi:GNAT superfamily N-acetyltransferase